jgi:hypothetical protein
VEIDVQLCLAAGSRSDPAHFHKSLPVKVSLTRIS